MGDTSIEWADKVWNPISGCSKVSDGCRNCYAERIAKRSWGARSFGDVHCHPERLDQPLRWRKPRRIFVDSMGDLFHEVVDTEFVRSVFEVMAAAQSHTFIILTKRAQRMRSVIDWISCTFDGSVGTKRRADLSVVGWPLPNVWLGVSVEDQRSVDERIPLLLETPAAVRILSCEPLLGPIDLTKLYGPCGYYCSEEHGHVDHGREPADWVIVGGESGPGARPCNVELIYSIIKQCRRAQVPVFVKQLGSNCGYSGDRHEWFQGRACRSADECGYVGVRRLRDPKGADPSEWPEDLRVHEFPSTQT